MKPARDSDVVTIKVPFAVRKRGGRKLVLAPDGAPVLPAAPHVDRTFVKAVGRAFDGRRCSRLGGMRRKSRRPRRSIRGMSVGC